MERVLTGPAAVPVEDDTVAELFTEDAILPGVQSSLTASDAAPDEFIEPCDIAVQRILFLDLRERHMAYLVAQKLRCPHWGILLPLWFHLLYL